MAVNLVSPGVSVREVDLTVGRIDSGNQQIGVLAGPFEKGPVNTPVLVDSEAKLLEVFGKPKLNDEQNEYWLSASNYLSYGGSLYIVRVESGDTSSLKLLNARYSELNSNLRINSLEDYINNHANDTDWYFSAKTPGTWANDLTVCVIDNFADQIISGISTTSHVTVVFDEISNLGELEILPGSTSLSGIDTSNISFQDNIYAPGVFLPSTGIVSIGNDSIILSQPSINVGVATTVVTIVRSRDTVVEADIQVGYGVTQILNKTSFNDDGTTSNYTGILRGIITGIGNDEIYVKITDRIDNNGTSFPTEYKNPGNPKSLSSLNIFSFDNARNQPLFISSPDGSEVYNYRDEGSITIKDWYDSQTLGLKNSTIFWKNIAPKPKTSQYAQERNSKNDEIHILVVDDTGKITGNSSNIVEKFLNLSKAVDARISPSQPIFFKEYISNNSNYIYAGANETGVPSTISGGTSNTFTLDQSFEWATVAQDKRFNVIGAKTYKLTNGKDYSGVENENGYNVTLAEVISGYELFRNTTEYDISYLISGPSGGNTLYDAQAKANSLISIAENRKDCIATISPYKVGILNATNTSDQTNNIINFFDPLASSSYAVFDSGYKYTFDRFNNKFVYIPCNSDVAGLMARTSNTRFPWFSPAGSSRGTLNNAVKLAYNPSQSQRDTLYSNRINPIISSPGAGIILFGDKTALSYASAFDRINVRKLFLTIEQSIEKAARAQLFEFNDAITRSNFVNIVEPYLRDVRAKRGISEFLIVCDETNNTPEVIDSNEFKADIFVKPARSINFVGLTFVATRTGVSFSEVVGSV